MPRRRRIVAAALTQRSRGEAVATPRRRRSVATAMPRCRRGEAVARPRRRRGDAAASLFAAAAVSPNGLRNTVFTCNLVQENLQKTKKNFSSFQAEVGVKKKVIQHQRTA